MKSGVPEYIKNTNIWRKIEEYPDYYINRLGDVFTTRFYKTGFVMKKFAIGEKNYVHLRSDDGKNRRVAIENLVAKAFVKNPNGYKYVLHKDGNTLNDGAINLEWVEKMPRKRDYRGSIQVVAFNMKTNEERNFDSIKAAAFGTGWSQAYVSKLLDQPKDTKDGWMYETKKPRKYVTDENKTKEEEKTMAYIPAPKKEERKGALAVATNMVKDIETKITLKAEKPPVDKEAICNAMMDGITKIPKEISKEAFDGWMVGYTACMKIVIGVLTDAK